MKLRTHPERPWPAWFGFLNLMMFLGPPIVVAVVTGLWGNGWDWLLGPMAIIMCIAMVNATDD